MREIVLLAIAILFVLGLISMCIVLISMGIDSRKLGELRNLFGKEYDFEVVGNIYDNPELLKGGNR